MKRLLISALLAALPASGMAQGDDPEDGDGGGPPRWGLGVAVVATDSPYAGEGTRVMPVPLVTYQGEKFYFRGITAGWQFVENDTFAFGAVASLRMDGFDIDDLGRTELARNGLDYRLLEDRDDGLDLGVSAKWSGAAGELELGLLADATDTSGGYEASLQYGYPFEIGKARITPNAGVKWMSKDMANYYYGTLDKEVARGVVDYKPGSVAVPHIGVTFARPIGEKWAMFASLEYSSLPDGIADSPFLERGADTKTSLIIGLSRGF